MPFIPNPFSNKWDTQIDGLLSKLLSCLPRIYVTNCVQDVSSKSYIRAKKSVIVDEALKIIAFGVLSPEKRKEDITTCV